ncbi:hypothetical protein D1872_305740 [compost metagenome]
MSAPGGWVKGVLYAFALWLGLTFITAVIGIEWHIYDQINQSTNLMRYWDPSARHIRDIMGSLWVLVPAISFLIVIVYMILSSLRRDINEYYV